MQLCIRTKYIIPRFHLICLPTTQFNFHQRAKVVSIYARFFAKLPAKVLFSGKADFKNLLVICHIAKSKIKYIPTKKRCQVFYQNNL